MSENNKSNLVEWAAMVTAFMGGIAAIITAIGFPEFVPDLVKQFFVSSNSQSVITEDKNGLSNPSQIASNNSETNANSPQEKVINQNKVDFADDIKFELINCLQINNKIECAVLATNQSVDKEIKIYAKDVRIIASGDQYIAKYIGIGNNQTLSEYRDKTKLVKDISIKIFANFDEIQSRVSSIELLEIVTSSDESIQLRNIQLSQ